MCFEGMLKPEYDVLINGEAYGGVFISLKSAEDFVSRWETSHPDDVCVIIFSE